MNKFLFAAALIVSGLLVVMRRAINALYLVR